MEINAKTEVNTTSLATILGITARRVQQLAQDGVIKAHVRGKYLLSDAVQRYIEYRSQEKEVTSAEKEKQEADVSIKKAKAIIAMLEAEEVQGKMHRSEDVAAMTEDLIYSIRGMLMALPGRLAADTADASTPVETSEIIRKEIYKVMEEISLYEYDPKKYEERVRERRSWDTLNGRDADDD